MKALFLIGGPGSGKDAVLRGTVLNTDKLTELALPTLVDAIKYKRAVPCIDLGENIVLNGNADNLDNILLAKKVLEICGYRTGMLYVYTTDEESKKRNDQRARLGARTYNEEKRAAKYQACFKNIAPLREAFASFNLFDNSFNPAVLLDEEKEQVAVWITELNKAITAFYSGEKSLDEQVAEFLGERSASEWTANQQITQTGRHKIAGKLDVANHKSGMNDYYSHNSQSTAKTVAQKKFDKAGSSERTNNSTTQVKASPQPAVTGPSHLSGKSKVNEGSFKQFREDVATSIDKPSTPAKKNAKKAAKAPVQLGDIRQGDGMSATATFSAESVAHRSKERQKQYLQNAVAHHEAQASRYKPGSHEHSYHLGVAAQHKQNIEDLDRPSWSEFAGGVKEEALTEGAHNVHFDFPVDKFPTTAHIEKHLHAQHHPHRKMGPDSAYDEDSQLARAKIKHHQVHGETDKNKIHDKLLDKAQKWEPLLAHKGATHWHVAGWIAESVITEAHAPHSVEHMKAAVKKFHAEPGDEQHKRYTGTNTPHYHITLSGGRYNYDQRTRQKSNVVSSYAVHPVHPSGKGSVWSTNQYGQRVAKFHQFDVHQDTGKIVHMGGDLEQHEEVQPKTLTQLRERAATKSPDAEFAPAPEAYEDWGLKSEESMYEGRAIKTNKPFKEAGRYAVYVMDGNVVNRLSFNKKAGTLNESVPFTDVRFWETLR